LLEEMIKQGAKTEDISAALFGCKLDPIGTANSAEAKGALKKLNIPIQHTGTDTVYNTRIRVHSGGIDVELTDSDQNLFKGKIPFSQS
jgi:chemotaxis receptor (MCP) glutamine deamidase CheD